MNIKRTISLLLISVLTLSLVHTSPTAKASSDTDWNFNNPIEFYKQMEDAGHKNKFICTNEHIYFAEKSKLASSGTKWKYQTVGYNLKIRNNKSGDEIIIDIARANEGTRDDSKYTAYTAKYVHGNDGFYYGIEVIPYQSILDQCLVKNESLAKKVFADGTVTIIINPIMTKKLYNVVQGGVTEQKTNGKKNGTVKDTPAVSGGENFHLKNSDDLKEFTNFFKSFNKEELTNIVGSAENFNIQLSYYIAPGKTTSSSKYSTKSNGYIDFGSDKTYTEVKLLGKLTLPTVNDLKIECKGYHLKSGKEWIYTKTNKTFKAGGTYYASDIDEGVKKSNTTGNFKANWEPNAYTIKFDKNGGTGSMSNKPVNYDEEISIPQNEFKKTGYEFAGWKVVRGNSTEALTAADYVTSSSMASGTNFIYSDGKLKVKNLTDTNGETVTFVAQWKPKTYKVSLYKGLTKEESASDSSTNNFYSTYGSFFSSNGKDSSKITTITLPTKVGYDFEGYYGNENYTGDKLIVPQSGNVGKINFANTYLTKDTILYAKWKAKTITLTLDANTTGKEGAVVTNALQTFNAIYDEPLPSAATPTTNGYTFKGFFTGKNGQGTCYYTPYMAPTVNVSKFTKNITLYAYWVDEVKPTTKITPESDGWTNSTDNTANGQTDDGYKIIFEANDNGSGIAKMEIYKENVSGTFELIKSSTNVKETITQTNEGIYRYKVVATDKAGNKSVDRFCTIYYDKTSPKIVTATGNMDSLTNVSGTISATDNEE